MLLASLHNCKALRKFQRHIELLRNYKLTASVDITPRGGFGHARKAFAELASYGEFPTFELRRNHNGSACVDVSPLAMDLDRSEAVGKRPGVFKNWWNYVIAALIDISILLPQRETGQTTIIPPYVSIPMRHHEIALSVDNTIFAAETVDGQSLGEDKGLVRAWADNKGSLAVHCAPKVFDLYGTESFTEGV